MMTTATKPIAAIDRLSEDGIGRLVDAFYAKIRADAELGSIFMRAISSDWEPHFATMRNFWSSVMLTSGRYKGNPVAVHGQVVGIEMELFDRWLGLFDESCQELFVADIADVFYCKAVRIAESRKFALFYRPGRPWPRSAP